MKHLYCSQTNMKNDITLGVGWCFQKILIQPEFFLLFLFVRIAKKNLNRSTYAAICPNKPCKC